ncbi:MAG: ATP-dependent zinc metalloprotease FtsH [Anaerolineales bacterium]|nr:ATP-dependent zinc metalloprotease FtsH [Anaerolineales bacterium]
MTIYKDSAFINIAKVVGIDKNENHIFIEFINGNTAILLDADQYDLKIGSIIFIDTNSNYIGVAPSELWPDATFCGIVRLKLEDITVIDTGGRWVTVPTASVSYTVGNTVEVKASKGVLRVLSDAPIKLIDLPTVDEGVINNFKIPLSERSKLTFDDFGGLQDVVNRTKQLIEVSLKNKRLLQEIGSTPIKGVLFTGEPGTGKTMLARIIANNTNSAFYEIKGPEIVSKWYGQSEEILRKIFQDAQNEEQAIIFFDEIDSIAGQRDSESHEASRRLVAQLLTLMDGFTPNDNIVVIATSNRPQDIDVALRRPGRFDWEIKFPLPDYDDRVLILQTISRHRKTSGKMPHEHIAKKTNGWSAADLKAIWVEAALLAVEEKRGKIIVEDYIGGFERVKHQKLSAI